MKFLLEPEPQRCVLTEVAPGIRRVVARNLSKMTYHGTNSYLIDTPDGTYVLDPGPAEDEDHFRFLVQSCADGLSGILISHHHSDHFGLVPRLRAATGAAVFGSNRFADDSFRPDVPLRDGDVVSGLLVLHTPGHASDHLCFAQRDGTVFTADHIMTWSSSIVPLPDGDMSDYCNQLRRMIDRGDALYLPGHGPPMAEPIPYVRRLLDNREQRETMILSALKERPHDAAELAWRLYRKADSDLAWAAQRNVEAHLLKLQREGKAARQGDLWHAAA